MRDAQHVEAPLRPPYRTTTFVRAALREDRRGTYSRALVFRDTKHWVSQVNDKRRAQPRHGRNHLAQAESPIGLWS